MAFYPNNGSIRDRAYKLALGERTYIETTADRFQTVQAAISARSRYPGAMQDMVFTTAVFTAVAASKVGEVRYLVCVERTT